MSGQSSVDTNERVFMQLSVEEMDSVLAARRYLYTVFQSLLGNEPTIEQIQAIDCDLAREALRIMEKSSIAAPDQRVDRVVATLFEILGDYHKDISMLQSEYTRLFIGPENLPAPPWESVYIEKERMLFTITTLNVREFYRSQGFLPAEYPHVADDHIALELDFLANVATKAIEAQSEDNKEALSIRLEGSAQFLDDHLLKWIDAFSDDIADYGDSHFYGNVALAAATFVALDRQVLARLLT